MKLVNKLILVGISIFTLPNLNAQIISQFDFDSNPVEIATVGPNATSISGSAVSSPGGTGGTNGLNAGLPKADINMVIPGSPTFDVGGIDVSFDYHREESSGNFFERGASLRIIGFNQLRVQYRVDNGGGGFNTVTSGNQYAIPNDDTYRRYRFIYTPCDGIGMLLVDGAVVWSNDGLDNRDLYWVGAGNVVVGSGMDGTGNNDTFFDNLVVGEVTCSPLPVEFSEVSAEYNSKGYNSVYWTTQSERNNSHFVVEKMGELNEWISIGQVAGAGFSTEELNYSQIDISPETGINYYRVKQVDFDNNFSYSNIVSVQTPVEADLKVYPNPSNGQFTVSGYKDHLNGSSRTIQIISLQGERIRAFPIVDSQSTNIDLGDITSGYYLLVIGNTKSTIVINQ
jgi:hypothetical protein